MSTLAERTGATFLVIFFGVYLLGAAFLAALDFFVAADCLAAEALALIIVIFKVYDIYFFKLL